MDTNLKTKSRTDAPEQFRDMVEKGARRNSSKAIRRPVMPARFISLGWRIKDCLAARLG